MAHTLERVPAWRYQHVSFAGQNQRTGEIVRLSGESLQDSSRNIFEKRDVESFITPHSPPYSDLTGSFLADVSTVPGHAHRSRPANDRTSDIRPTLLLCFWCPRR